MELTVAFFFFLTKSCWSWERRHLQCMLLELSWLQCLISVISVLVTKVDGSIFWSICLLYFSLHMMQDLALTWNRKMCAWHKNTELVKPSLQILCVCVCNQQQWQSFLNYSCNILMVAGGTLAPSQSFPHSLPFWLQEGRSASRSPQPRIAPAQRALGGHTL